MRIFISHAVEDEAVASALRDMIRRCSLNKIEVWFSTDRTSSGGMPIGGPWFSELHNKLKAADWIVAIVTPESISSPWIYFECGFVASVHSQGVIPLTVGLPASSVPMPLAAYQIYDSANAASLATFLQKLLEADGIFYDEEMTQTVRDSTQRRMIDYQKKRSEERNTNIAIQSDRGDVAALRNFIEQRFVELYRVIPTEKKPKLSLELSFDVSDIFPKSPFFILNVSSEASVLDVLNEIYFRLLNEVDAYTYLVDWTIVDSAQGSDISIIEIAERVPASLIFNTDGKYKIRPLDGRGDSYIEDALNRSARKRKGR
jgi:hypothetical protein